MKKITAKEAAELKQLFVVYLDLSWSSELQEDCIKDISESLKESKKLKKKIDKNLAKVVAKYTELNGRPPISYKKG